jgi:predicted alpha/beta-fold hydrolase
MPGIIRAFNRRGWDGVAMNFRGCSGEPNRLLRSYHAGATEDLQTVIEHVLSRYSYRRLAIVGFSLGGNLTLKYLGESRSALPPNLSCAAAISTPCDLESSAWQLSEPSNYLYLQNFFHDFHQKIRAKMQIFPGQISDRHFHQIKTLKDFDDRYTAPLHGFKDAKDYWTKCSARQFLSGIRVPTLLLNALDDPFLRSESYPIAEAQHNPCLFLETPSAGGHVGFVAMNRTREYWHETRVTAFMTDHCA